MNALSKFIADNSIKGFLAEEEGMALHDSALGVGDIGPCLEIGSYCGLSTVYLGKACERSGNTLYALDHHRGSEEHQRGEEYHDPQLFDTKNNCMDSFPSFRRTLDLADLNEVVVPIVSASRVAARHWRTPLGLVFVDGGHSLEAAMFDCLTWSKKLAQHGILAVHDLFEHPHQGGQAPYLAFQAVLNSGDFEFVAQVQSLGFLRKKIPFC